MKYMNDFIQQTAWSAFIGSGGATWLCLYVIYIKAKDKYKDFKERIIKRVM